MRKYVGETPTIVAPTGGQRTPLVIDTPVIVADRSRHLNKKGRKLESPKNHANSLTGVAKDNLLMPLRLVRSDLAKKARAEHMKNGVDYTPWGPDNRDIKYNQDGTTGCLTGVYSKDALIGNELQIRRLTPLECERLQGFPDNWTEGISDTQRYKCLGNAVTVNVIEFLGQQLINCLGAH